MLTYILSRLLQSVLVILGVLLLVFFIVNLTGDPVRIMLPPEANQEDVERLRVQMGLDRPLPEQFVRFLGGAMHGDFGESLRYRGQPALRQVTQRFPATLQLAGATLFWSLPAALLLGTIAAVRRNSALDNLAIVSALLGQSLPSFWLGLMLILTFAVQLGLLPSSGYGEPRHVILPAFTLGAFFMARNTRLIRSGMIEVLEQDYIRTARAKGVRERLVVVRHAIKNMAIPVVTIIGLDIGQLLGGAVVTETVFAWPGIGRLAIDSILNRDFPVLEADVFFIALAFVGINLLIDVGYTWLDPRVRVR
ncbi:MAG TPA: ABC transporter permease [Candidatus Baltobacteraceae bacterium]|nr:ABC transporter permease [Candidatus Baltobacteraceae bacterium]